MSKISLQHILLVLVLTACQGPSPSPEQPSASAYFTRVWDYHYAPGQHARFIGDGKTESEKILGTDPGYVRLGGWGGFIVAGFDHDVPNKPGMDIGLYTQPGQGNEPGVVFVMEDENRNGLPDDQWFELSGGESESDYGPDDRYVRQYRLTYFLPSEGEDNLYWEDNLGRSGTLVAGYGEVTRTWWWKVGLTEVSLEGVLLPVNKSLQEGVWLDIPGRFAWGYAENYGGTDLQTLPFGKGTRSANTFDLSQTVDPQGESITLSSVRFVKIQTGVFLQTGVLNETSTEISGGVDLHLLGELP